MKKLNVYYFLILLLCGCENPDTTPVLPITHQPTLFNILCYTDYSLLEKKDTSCVFEQWDDESNVQESMEGKIRLRGNSTAECPKRPFALKLDKKVSLCNMPEAKKWVLLANWYDRTMLRNALAFYMSEDSRMDWTPHSCYVDLYYNNEYKGIYQLCEKVEVNTNRVNVERDGWLIEVDTRVTDEDVYFTTKHMENPFRIDYPDKKITEEQFEQIRMSLQKAEEILFGDNFAHPEEGWRKYLDEDSWIDWYLINEIAKNNDAIFYTSCYMHSTKNGSIAMGPIWDFDLGYGNTTLNECNLPEGWHVRLSSWYSRLFEDPLFVLNVKKRFQFFYDNRENYYAFIRQHADNLSVPMRKNDSIWQLSGDTFEKKNTYNEEVDALIMWMERRLEWMKNSI